MKQLDWKSFAIGILLTTTVVFGVAATNPTFGKQWDEEQKWLIKKVAAPMAAKPEKIKLDREEAVGWELIDIRREGTSQYLIYRRPVVKWPDLPSVDKGDWVLYRSKHLNYIWP